MYKIWILMTLRCKSWMRSKSIWRWTSIIHLLTWGLRQICCNSIQYILDEWEKDFSTFNHINIRIWCWLALILNEDLTFDVVDNCMICTKITVWLQWNLIHLFLIRNNSVFHFFLTSHYKMHLVENFCIKEFLFFDLMITIYCLFSVLNSILYFDNIDTIYALLESNCP